VRVFLDGRVLRGLTWFAIAVCCAPALYLRYLPMVELPQYVALSRMLLHLHDPQYSFSEYYELALDRSLAVLPLYLLGGLSELIPHDAATRAVVWLSVLSYPLGLCALLRAQGKPIVYVLLGIPLIYPASFYLGLLPSLASTGLALYMIALLHSAQLDRPRLALVSLVLPLTHPFSVCVALSFVGAKLCTERSSWRQLPWLGLSPLLLGGAYWGVRAVQADGVAAFRYPGLAFRLLRVPETILGGFSSRGEAYMLGALLVLWLWLMRGQWPTHSTRWRALTSSERALWISAAWFLAGYLLLPSSTWTTGAIHVRSGGIAFALLPVLLPRELMYVSRTRVIALLFTLAAGSISYTSAQLVRFDREAQPFAAVLERTRQRPKLVSLSYDNRGQLARGNPYLHFAAYAQAEHGGFLGLSAVDYSWTAPLRRRQDAAAVPPVFGSEWDPALLQAQPDHFRFYDAAITRGSEPREMTMLTVASFELAAQSGQWLLYVRPAVSD